MKIQEVNNSGLVKEFLEFPVKLYKNEKNWIRPLDKDIEFVFDRQKNKYFKDGDAIRWLMKDDKGRVIGRIAAFYHRKTSAQSEIPTGGVGFFECINDQQAANLLFDTAKTWLSTKGFEAMDGPVNFGDRNEWWGLLTEGFFEPNYGMHFNFKYYQELFENYGFKLFFKQYTYYKSMKNVSLPEEVERKASMVSKDQNYSFIHIDRKNLRKYAEDFRYVFNKAWAKFKGVGEMSESQAYSLLKKIKPIMDERLIWLGYYNEEPIAIFIMLPEMNQLFKHLNGKFNWWAKFKLLLLKSFKPQTKVLGLIFGVIPKFQGKGVDGAIIKAFTEMNKQPSFKYEHLEMNWIGDFNPKMMRVVEKIGAEIKKVHVTYRYIFDREKEFRRASDI